MKERQILSHVYDVNPLCFYLQLNYETLCAHASPPQSGKKSKVEPWCMEVAVILLVMIKTTINMVSSIKTCFSISDHFSYSIVLCSGLYSVV